MLWLPEDDQTSWRSVINCCITSCPWLASQWSSWTGKQFESLMGKVWDDVLCCWINLIKHAGKARGGTHLLENSQQADVQGTVTCPSSYPSFEKLRLHCLQTAMTSSTSPIGFRLVICRKSAIVWQKKHKKNHRQPPTNGSQWPWGRLLNFNTVDSPWLPMIAWISRSPVVKFLVPMAELSYSQLVDSSVEGMDAWSEPSTPGHPISGLGRSWPLELLTIGRHPWLQTLPIWVTGYPNNAKIIIRSLTANKGWNVN